LKLGRSTRTINLVGKPSTQVLDTQTILCYTRSVQSMKLAAACQRRVRCLKGDRMKFSVTNVLMALGLVTIGVTLAAAGIYIGDTDDAPGAALLGILLLIGAVALGVRTVRRKV
jgi:uncharacterized membrane protein